MHAHILVPTDGSELSLKAVRQGLQMAKAFGSRITAITVRPPLRDFIAEGVAIPVTEEARREYARQADHHLDAARTEAKALGVPLETVQVENDQPWKAIIETAKDKGVDLIVMASHGRRGVSALVLGSETNKVLTHSTVPVLVYR